MARPEKDSGDVQDLVAVVGEEAVEVHHHLEAKVFCILKD
jgi:hypothetical protein